MDFDTWLNQRLQELKTDETVFGPYIKSILEGDEDLEQKVEDLDGILGELGDPSLDVKSLRSEFLSRWEDYQQAAKIISEEKQRDALSKPGVVEGASSLDSQLEKLLHLSPEQLVGTSTNKTDKEAPDSELRAAILKQYQQDDSGSDEEDGTRKPLGTLDGLDKNTNAERVLSAQKEMKEQARADAAKKREKDREDRTRQKKLAEEKKEKAKKKTAKVERKQR